MSEHTIHISLIQTAIPTWDVQANLKHTSQFITQAASQGADLVVLSELHALPYFCQTQNTDYFDYAQTLQGPIAQTLAAWARQYNMVIVGSLFERRAPGLYHNTALVFDRTRGLVGTYRKMHIPDDPGFNEKFYFTPGDATERSFAPINTSIGKLGVLICWDQWFPEAARLSCLQGANLLIYPTAIGFDRNDTETEQKKQLEAWITVQRGHAIGNQIPVIAANRTGFEPHPNHPSAGIDFWGNSFIGDERGEIIQKAPANQETLLSTQINLKDTESTRRIWPFLRDRRVDAYANLTQRFIND